MAPVTRRSRRSQTIDHDELADDKIGAASILQNKPSIPRKRGRPRKYPKQPPRPKGQGPKPRPRERPSKTRAKKGLSEGYPHEEHDRQIATMLNWRLRLPMTGKRMGDAVRTVFEITNQWPLELTAGFSPIKWGVEIMENLRKLFRILDKQIATNDYGNGFQVVKDFLRDRAQKRNRRYPHLINEDVSSACAHFSVRNLRRSEVAQTTRVRTQIRRLTTLVESDVEGDTNAENSQDEWEDWIDHQYNDDASTDQDETTVRHGKRHNSPSESSRVRKRARATESDTDANIQLNNDTLPDLAEAPSYSDTSRFATGPTRRSYTFEDLIEGPRWLESKKQEEMEEITCSLQTTTASVQATEASIAEATYKRASNKTLDELRIVIENSEEERKALEKEALQKGKELLDGNHMDMLRAAILAKTMEEYSARLQEYDKYIAEANDKILAEQNSIDKEDANQQKKLDEHKVEAQRLGICREKVLQEVKFCRILASMAKLGPSGMANLLAYLEVQGIFLPEQIERIMQGGDTSA
ncbi:hypothetical protein FSARC_8733 [Fusarium sarcochroum]|uniref:Uncharacterized protein n=1 Tax=Fusarium sarcochroum TaxID=1208366 RepID=A0A8H4TSI4_9HYPO|nr:hypothetical protein FSARC_8733 [Fusarium sarcochroum]